MINNRDIAVIYKSKYGSTKKYAGWIALKLDADLYEITDVKAKHLNNYKTIIFGGYLFNQKIKGIEFITKNYELLRHKNLIVFTTGIRLQNNDNVNEILENNFTEEIRDDIKLYYFKGAFNYETLNIKDKMIIRALRASIIIKEKDKVDNDSKYILEICENPIDYTNKKLIGNFLEYLMEKI